MIGITFNVQNLDTVLQAYDQIELIRYEVETSTTPDTPVGELVSLTDWTAVSGTDEYPLPINLVAGTDVYVAYDPLGDDTDWYSSRYVNSTTSGVSAWSTPILGTESDLLYDPVYPTEDNTFTNEEKSIIKRIRVYIGDPVGLVREAGEEALASLHPDGRTFELAEKGWPVYVTMGGKGFTSKNNPAVNGYKYLKFQENVSKICYSCVEDAENLCGNPDEYLVTSAIDIWYNTFRHSDKQILDAYDSCPPPEGLTSTNTTSQAYILQTAVDLLTQELWEDASEDGASVEDDKTKYDPEPGLKIRKDLLDDLKKRLDDLVKSLILVGITGVLID